MIFNKPVNIPFADQLAEHTEKGFMNCDTDLLYVKIIKLPDSLTEEINSYLDELGISSLLSVLCFKRKNITAGYEFSHLDWCPALGLINCSVVIPVSGCAGTGQKWYDGDYTYYGEKQTDRNGRGVVDVARIKWNSPGVLVNTLEIVTPQLVKTDMPHNAFSNGSEYRVTCTFRFAKNESFDYVAERLSA